MGITSRELLREKGLRMPNRVWVRDVELAALIQTSYERSRRTYGARRVHMELREAYDVRVEQHSLAAYCRLRNRPHCVGKHVTDRIR